MADLPAVPDPKTLQEAIQVFTDEMNCIAYLVAKRWPKGVTCPTCGNTKIGFLAKQKRFQCNKRHRKQQFSVKVGTIFEDSPLGLDKWLPVVWLITNCKNGVSSWEIHRDMGVTQKTAWFMLHRVRLAMQDENFGGGKLGGEVEVDETFIGGKARNMHRDRKARAHASQGGSGKMVVIGALQREGKVITKVAGDRKRDTIQPFVQENVDKGTEIHSDEHAAVWRMDSDYSHKASALRRSDPVPLG